jgi:hypothetical protein
MKVYRLSLLFFMSLSTLSWASSSSGDICEESILPNPSLRVSDFNRNIGPLGISTRDPKSDANVVLLNNEIYWQPTKSSHYLAFALPFRASRLAPAVWGNHIALASANYVFTYALDSSGLKLLRKSKFRAEISAVNFSPDGTLLGVATNDGDVWVIERREGGTARAFEQRFLKGNDVDNSQKLFGLALAFSHDNLRLAVASTDTSLRVWDLEHKAKVFPFALAKWRSSEMSGTRVTFADKDSSTIFMALLAHKNFYWGEDRRPYYKDQRDRAWAVIDQLTLEPQPLSEVEDHLLSLLPFTHDTAPWEYTPWRAKVEKSRYFNWNYTRPAPFYADLERALGRIARRPSDFSELASAGIGVGLKTWFATMPTNP